MDEADELFVDPGRHSVRVTEFEGTICIATNQPRMGGDVDRVTLPVDQFKKIVEAFVASRKGGLGATPWEMGDGRLQVAAGPDDLVRRSAAEYSTLLDVRKQIDTMVRAAELAATQIYNRRMK